MKKPISLFTMVIAAALVGCGDGSKNSASALQKSTVLNNCMKQTSSTLYNNKSVRFDTATFTSTVPSESQSEAFGRMVISRAKSSTDVSKLLTQLNSHSNLVMYELKLTSGKDSATCRYMTFRSLSGDTIKTPVLFQIQKNNDSPLTAYNDSPLIEKNVFEFIKDYPLPVHGLWYFKLDTQQVTTKAQGQALDKLQSILLNATTASETFQDLGDRIQINNASELARYAVSNLDVPEYVLENPMYLTPVVVSRQVTRLANINADDMSVRRMDKFNEERYVDPNTGINIHNDTLAELKNDYGLVDDRTHNIVIEEVNKQDMFNRNVAGAARTGADTYTDNELKDAKIN
ncbi:MAG: hypothetical protein L0G96_15500 [Acinetobacter sp.]|nr:hypothetical protein [Acinetobacter sp.]